MADPVNGGDMSTSFPPRLYRGSVKDVYGISGRSPYVFAFSDRYSVFDWGEMPDLLENKGEAVALIADFFFRYLSSHGVRHHSLGLVDGNMSELNYPRFSRYLAVEPVDVLRPRLETVSGKTNFVYEEYQKRPVGALVPLEVIFRFGTPKGSSFLERAAANPALLKEVGLTRAPEPGALLERPIVEFSSKLEPSDRPLSYADAQAIAGLSDLEFDALRERALAIAALLKNLFARFDVELWDGKFEFAFAPPSLPEGRCREFLLVDSIGPDELRLLYRGHHLSKEILRQVYRSSPWYSALQRAKIEAHAAGRTDWKEICRKEFGEEPDPLEPSKKRAAENIYLCLANEIAKALGRDVPFPKAPSLEELAISLGELG